VATIDETLRRKAAEATDETALIIWTGDLVSALTWAELDDRTAREAAAFSGVSSSGRVALATIGNDLASVVTLIAVLRSDLPLVILPRRTPVSELRVLCEVLRARGSDVLHLGQEAGRVCPSAADGQTALPGSSLLMTTGGSAGRPKVVIDGRLRRVGEQARGTRPSSMMNWRPGQRQLVVGPLHHAATLTFFIEGLADGNVMIVLGFFDASVTLSAIESCKVEWLQMTPYHLQHLEQEISRQQADVSHIRGLLHMAAPCPDQLKHTWLGLVGPRRVFEMYGSSENVGITLARGDQWLERPGTVGRGFFTQVRILDRQLRAVAPRQEGQIFMRSAASPNRYLDPTHSLRLTADGFASVGDRGLMDAEGFLYLSARQLARIQVGGETVDPAEVEAVLRTYPGIREAAVCGVSNRRLGEVLVAVVTGLAEREARPLRTFLLEHLARHKVPRRVMFAEALPRTESGKLDRPRLAEFVAAAAETGSRGAPAAVSGSTEADHGAGMS
jgi:bile acid-coenzyme A ligase